MILWFLATICVGALYLYDKYKLSYWSRRGVKSPPSKPFFGQTLPVVLTKKASGDVVADGYRLFSKERYFGLYEFHRPVLVLRDLKLIKDVLVKDFSHFSDHPNWIFDDRTYLRHGLLKQNGNLWRAFRYRLIPSFTGFRMEKALERILSSAHLAIQSGEVEMREVMNIFAADSIAAYFATEIREKNEFQKVIRKQFKMPILRFIEIQIVEHFPKLARLIGAQFVRSDLNTVYLGVMRDLSKGPSEFRTLMTEILEGGVIEMKAKDFDSTGEGGNMYRYVATEEIMLGQIAQFIIGGLDTTSNTMAFMAYELTKHPRVQEKARAQIHEVLAKYNGRWTYEAIKELTYLQNIIYETMRMRPVLTFLFRDATKDYELDDGLLVKKGDKIIIPSSALQMDPDYYEEPDIFNPERWESISEPRNNYTWLPFGDGPRQCLGMRFAFMEMKLVFAKILGDFEMSLSPKQVEPLKIHPRTFLTQIDGPLYINLKKL